MSAQPMPQARAFRGQQPGERVILIAHPARVRLLLPAWPLALGLAALAGVPVARSAELLPDTVAGVAPAAVGLATLLALGHWGLATAYPWWCRRAIITDRRVIMQRGGVRLATQEIPLGQVQSARVELRTFGEMLLGYGRVTITAAGGDPLTLPALARPQTFAHLVMQSRAAHAPPVAAATSDAPIADPAVRDIIDRLAKAEAPPPLPALDPPIGAKWPLRHAMTIPLEDGETVLGLISRHWWVLVCRAALPLALLAGAALVALAGAGLGQPALLATAALVGLAGALWFLLAYLNFVDDSFILTDRRLLDVQRRFFVLYEATDALEYGNIQEVRTLMPGAWARLVGYGTVQVSAAGTGAPIIMDGVPRPQRIEQAIEACRAAMQQRAQAAAANREKLELRDWFAAVVGEMVVAAPDLRGLTLEDAIERAYAIGLRLLVLGDSIVIPGLPAGIVVSQSPFPGSRALRGGDISVMLSRL
jgi:hypothetical protein